MAGRRGSKGLSDEDRALWRRVAATVRPLHSDTDSEAAKPAPAVAPPPVSNGTPAAPPAAPVAPARPKPPGVPPALPPLDRKVARSLGRGTLDVDATIDLHGMTQRAAHQRLLAFLQGAQAAGHRLVLVVTGKGRSDEEIDWWAEGTRGVLRRAVPEWLATPPFRPLVVGHERAHLRRGGDGAIYVQIRRSGRGPGRESGR